MYPVNANRHPFDVWIGRGGPFGNPVKRGLHRCPICSGAHAEPGDTLPCFLAYFARKLIQDARFRAQVHALKGKVLGCPCGGGKRCHGTLIASYLDYV